MLAVATLRIPKLKYASSIHKRCSLLMRISLYLLLSVFGCGLLASAHAASGVDVATRPVLGPPPLAEQNVLDRYLHPDTTEGWQKANQSSLSREQVVSLYNALYVPGNSVAPVGQEVVRRPVLPAPRLRHFKRPYGIELASFVKSPVCRWSGCLLPEVRPCSMRKHQP